MAAIYIVLGPNSRAPRGCEEVGVDAALHEVAGSVGGALEEGAELGVGGEEDAGETVEAGGGDEREMLDGLFDARGVLCGEMAGEPMHAAAGVLVDVSVPGGGERNAVAPGERGAEDAELAGAGDVEDVRTEAAEGAIDGARVAGEEGVEEEIFFEGDGGARAREFESVEVVDGGGRGGAGADAEEGQAAAVGEGGEVAAGMGDAVDLVERVGEEGDARRAHGLRVPCRVCFGVWSGRGSTWIHSTPRCCCGSVAVDARGLVSIGKRSACACGVYHGCEPSPLKGFFFMHRLASVSLFGALAFAAAGAQTMDVAATPPMGWNSWNHFAGRVTDRDIRAAADQMVATGMRDAGYVYVNIDDTWEAGRDAQGNILTNDRFPDMKALAEYVHSKGLKIGIYSSPGPKTCGGYEGSYQHEAQDAKTYAAWGIDYLKYDLCGYGEIMDREAGKNQGKAYAMMRAAFAKMGQALKATGRPIVYSLSQSGWDSIWRWGPSVGSNLWRTTGDINDSYGRMAEIGFSQAGLARYAGPGHWNDPDMLEIGNSRMTTDEYTTHMTLWAILAAPLLAGNDLTRMSPADMAILTNKDVIAVDQDLLGRQGDRVSAEGPFEVWTKPLRDGSVAVGLFNRGEDTEAMSLPAASALGLKSVTSIQDVWSPGNTTKGPWMVPGHGVELLIVH